MIHKNKQKVKIPIIVVFCLNKPESSVYVLTSSHIDIQENIECNSV